MKKLLLTAALAAALIVPATAVAQQLPPAEPAPAEPAPAVPAPTLPSPAAPAEEAETEADTADVLEVARASGNFTTLLRAIEVAGLTDTLSAAGPYTLFAPTDEAFAALPDGALDALLADPVALREVLLGHVLVARVNAADVQEKALTAAGAELGVSRDGERLIVGGASVVKGDIVASNGVIHAVDAVIIPVAEAGEAAAKP